MLTPKEILRYKFNKYVQDLYKENYKMLMNEMKDLNKEGDILFSWFRRLNIIKMAILLKVIYRFNTIPIKIPIGFWRKLTS